jgi:hypothetical protein
MCEGSVSAFFKPGTATPRLRFWPNGWGGAFVRMSEYTSYHEAARGEPFWPSPSIAGSFRSDRFVGRGTRDKPKDSRPRLRPSGLRRRCFLRHTTSQPARSALISQNDALLRHGRSINGSGDRNSAHALQRSRAMALPACWSASSRASAQRLGASMRRVMYKRRRNE